MPSRFLILVIVSFWLATTGWFVAREILPRWRAGKAPPYVIELADEALKNQTPTKWRIIRNGKDIGVLSTKMVYNQAEDFFELTAEGKDIHVLNAAPIQVTARDFKNVVKVNHDGELRGQHTVVVLETPIGEVRGELAADVKGDRIVRSCVLDSPLGKIAPALEPLAYRRGSVLDPTHPVNRVTGLRPGQQFRVPLVDPLGDALKATVAEVVGGKSSAANVEPVAQFLYAEVLAQPQNLKGDGGVHACLVIEYTGEDFTARTWVRAADGLVLRQEARADKDELVLQREHIPPFEP